MSAYQTFSRVIPTKKNIFFVSAKDKPGIGIPVLLQQVIAAVALLLLAPILLIAIILIYLESSGSSFYAQTRVGHNGRLFKLYKLRSMYLPDDSRYVDISAIKSDREGACKKLFNDPRITRVGKFIRKFSIDELPQIWNVIVGDMVLIGPRPALPNEVADYSYRALSRLNVIPGLTGLWQVSGRADTTFEEQIDLDLQYIKEQSILLDVKILLSTIPAVLSGRGAY